MRLVLCGSRQHFDTFKEKLWEKDKDIGNLVYVGDPERVRGYCLNKSNVIRLGSFHLHPNHDEISDVAVACGYSFQPRTGFSNRRIHRFGDGGIVSGSSLSSIADQFQRVYGDRVASMTQSGASLLSTMSDESNRWLGESMTYSIDPQAIRDIGTTADGATLTMESLEHARDSLLYGTIQANQNAFGSQTINTTRDATLGGMNIIEYTGDVPERPFVRATREAVERYNESRESRIDTIVYGNDSDGD